MRVWNICFTVCLCGQLPIYDRFELCHEKDGEMSFCEKLKRRLCTWVEVNFEWEEFSLQTFFSVRRAEREGERESIEPLNHLQEYTFATVNVVTGVS